MSDKNNIEYKIINFLLYRELLYKKYSRLLRQKIYEYIHKRTSQNNEKIKFKLIKNMVARMMFNSNKDHQELINPHFEEWGDAIYEKLRPELQTDIFDDIFKKQIKNIIYKINNRVNFLKTRNKNTILSHETNFFNVVFSDLNNIIFIESVNYIWDYKSDTLNSNTLIKKKIYINMRYNSYNWQSLHKTIKERYKKFASYYILITIIKYEYILCSGNFQCSYNTGKVSSSHPFHVELFGSPINRHISRDFCSKYRSDLKYRGCLGCFFDYKLESNKNYLCNPPFISMFIEKAVKHILRQLDDNNNLKNINITVIIPIKDNEGLKLIGMSKLKFGYECYAPLELLKKSKYFKSLKIVEKRNISFYNHNKNKSIHLSDIYMIQIVKE
jgi:hypothetical protein